MAVPADPAQVQAQFQAMTNYFANTQQSVMTPLLQSAEAKLAQYGPGAHDFPGMTINYEAVVQGLRADIAQAGQWLSNARALLASGSAEAIQAMRQMLASGSIQVVVEEGAATLEPAAPAIITGGLAGAGAGIAEASGMSLMAAVGLGLAGGLVLAGLIGGGYWAYNHYRQANSAQPIAAVTTTQAAPPPTPVPTDTGGPTETAAPGQLIPPPLQPPPPVETGQSSTPGETVQPPPPVLEPSAITTATTTASAAPVDIDGTYSLTPSCPVSRCWLKVTRQGSGTVQFTLSEHTFPQYPNEGFTISQLQATLDSSGVFRGAGTATEEDVGGQGHVTHAPVSYTITGNFRDASGGPLTTSPASSYNLRLEGDSSATTNGAAAFNGQR